MKWRWPKRWLERWARWALIASSAIAIIFGIRACFANNAELANFEPQPEIAAELTLQSVTLEQPDEDGTLLWRLKADSVNYVPDTQRAELTQLKGEFFQAGQTVYTVEANEGEVLQNGNTLFLRGDLIAQGSENELTLEGEKLKWIPKQDLLVMGEFDDSANSFAEELTDEELTDEELTEPGESPEPASESAPDSTTDQTVSPDLDNAPVTGFNPQIKAGAQLIRVNNREKRVELTGGVLAESKESPWLLFESDALTWFTDQELIEAAQPIKVEQFESDAYQTVTDRLVGQTGQVELVENRVTINQGVQLDALTQPLTVNSEQAVWDVDAETVKLDQPVNIVQPERQVNATADRASLDLASQVIVLIGNVRAVGAENDARLAADTVTWQTTTQQVEAVGNVRYQQADEPDISIAGPRAVGNIEAGTLVIEGGETGEVVTEIVPEGL